MKSQTPIMSEIEKTFLAKSIPFNTSNHPYSFIEDYYLILKDPKSKFRIRNKNNTSFTLTKKTPASSDSFSSQLEQDIQLDQDEFTLFSSLPNRKVSKKRYEFRIDELTYEFDIFQEELNGLVLVEVEFSSKEQLESFKKPDFCLIDVTEDTFISGNFLAGKSISDINDELQEKSYSPINI